VLSKSQQEALNKLAEAGKAVSYGEWKRASVSLMSVSSFKTARRALVDGDYVRITPARKYELSAAGHALAKSPTTALAEQGRAAS
jgi:hypothetical protein